MFDITTEEINRILQQMRSDEETGKYTVEILKPLFIQMSNSIEYQRNLVELLCSFAEHGSDTISLIFNAINIGMRMGYYIAKPELVNITTEETDHESKDGSKRNRVH